MLHRNIADWDAQGPMKFLLMVAKNHTDAFNALLNAYLQISENIPQFSQYQTLFHGNPHMQEALSHIYKDILEFHREALRYFRTSSRLILSAYEIMNATVAKSMTAWKELFHATSRSFNNTVAHLSQNLHRHKTLIESQASIVEFKVLQDLRIQCQRQFEKQNSAELERRRLSVLQWLCPPDAQARHEDAAKARHGTSSRWLFSASRFIKWFNFNYCAEPLL